MPLFPRTLIQGLAVGTAVLLLSSCQQLSARKNDQRVHAVTDRLRPLSLEKWKRKTIKGEDALNYASSVAAILLPMDVEVSLSTVKLADGRDVVKSTLRGDKSGLRGHTSQSYSFGTAVPISQDGYFLTAAHCIGKKSSTIQILAKTASPPVSLSVARIVWRSDEINPNEADLAVLHAPVKPEIHVKPAAWDRLKIGNPILTSGYGSFKKSWAGGRLRSINEPRTAPSGVTSTEVTHTAPFTPGDSGGPILSEDGELIGINSQMVLTTSGWLPFALGRLRYDHGVCFIPDSDWLNSILQRDRSRPKKKP